MGTAVQRKADILRVTVQLMDEGGEAAVRLRDVARLVGITQPSLFYYFKNREQLIVAAHCERFRANLEATLKPFVARLSVASSRDEFVRSLLSLYADSFPAARTRARALRAEVVGLSFGRPTLRDEIARTTREMFAPAVELLRGAQANGWIRQELDIDAFAYWNLATISSLIFTEQLADDETLRAGHALMLENVELVVTGTVSRFSS